MIAIDDMINKIKNMEGNDYINMLPEKMEEELKRKNDFEEAFFWGEQIINNIDSFNRFNENQELENMLRTQIGKMCLVLSDFILNNTAQITESTVKSILESNSVLSSAKANIIKKYDKSKQEAFLKNKKVVHRTTILTKLDDDLKIKFLESDELFNDFSDIYHIILSLHLKKQLECLNNDKIKLLDEEKEIIRKEMLYKQKIAYIENQTIGLEYRMIEIMKLNEFDQIEYLENNKIGLDEATVTKIIKNLNDKNQINCLKNNKIKLNITYVMDIVNNLAKNKNVDVSDIIINLNDDKKLMYLNTLNEFEIDSLETDQIIRSLSNDNLLNVIKNQVIELNLYQIERIIEGKKEIIIECLKSKDIHLPEDVKTGMIMDLDFSTQLKLLNDKKINLSKEHKLNIIKRI